MLYHALTRILTSPSWGSGMAFLVTLSLFRPPKPESSTARISFESGALTVLSGSLAPFFSIICSVSSAVSVPSFAISAGLAVLTMLLQQVWRDFSSARRVTVLSSGYSKIYGRLRRYRKNGTESEHRLVVLLKDFHTTFYLFPSLEVSWKFYSKQKQQKKYYY